ncbi:1,4-dihydroxy-2-naphthoate polyprenyltransferase [bacterium]|nr:1,4-dihydroxy-2-naphthoate polyprenyltransferase [bacterium]
MEEEAKSLAGIWIMASRPKTLWAGISPVIIGTAMAYSDGKAHWLSAFLAFFGAVMIQIGTNFANDYFDFIHGADQKDRLGPKRVTQAGLVKPKTIKTAFVIVFSLAALAGLYLAIRGGWPVIIICILSIISGILYTGGPFPLGYHGLGDLFVLIFFGLVAVGGTYYVQALEINEYVIIAGFAPGLLSTAILTVNNMRDIHTDRQAGKKTLAVRFGERFARMEYIVSVLAACLLVPVLLYFLSPGHPFALIATIACIFALPSIKKILSEKPGPVFNRILANTGGLLLLYSMLFSIGWIL